MFKKNINAVLTALALAVAVYFFVTYHPDSGPHEGEVAPDFALPDRNGKIVHLSDFRGKPVLIHFWATWCGTCTHEMPQFNAMARQFRDSDLVILGLSLDDSGRGTGWKAVAAYEQRQPLDFTVLMDSRGAVADQFGTYALPESYLLDRDGRVVRKWAGEQEWSPEKIRKTMESYNFNKSK